MHHIAKFIREEADRRQMFYSTLCKKAGISISTFDNWFHKSGRKKVVTENPSVCSLEYCLDVLGWKLIPVRKTCEKPLISQDLRLPPTFRSFLSGSSQEPTST